MPLHRIIQRQALHLVLKYLYYRSKRIVKWPRAWSKPNEAKILEVRENLALETGANQYGQRESDDRM